MLAAEDLLVPKNERFCQGLDNCDLVRTTSKVGQFVNVLLA